VRKYEEYARRAAAAGAHVVCLPELSLSGYPTGSTLQDGLAQPLDGALSRAMLALSRETGLVVLAGLLERDRSGVVYGDRRSMGRSARRAGPHSGPSPRELAVQPLVDVRCTRTPAERR
jgi:predicted amidohydrolase